MYLLRVQLPDRPGSLGAVATALGSTGADINAVEIVERLDGFAVDDFIVDLRGSDAADALVAACVSVAEVSVHWITFFPEHWSLVGDIQVLDLMTETPKRARQIMTDWAPRAFRAEWAVLLDSSGRVSYSSDLAPDITDGHRFGPLDRARTRTLPKDWWPGWPEVEIAVAPCGDGGIVVGRRCGLAFLDTEVLRLKHLANLAAIV